MFLFYDSGFLSVCGGLDKAERTRSVHPGRGNALKRSLLGKSLPNGRMQRQLSGRSRGNGCCDTRNCFSKSEGNQIQKQSEPWTWPWATGYRSALCWAGVCTEWLLTDVIESHWVCSHQLHLVKGSKYIHIKSYSLASDEHIFSTYKLSVQEGISHPLLTCWFLPLENKS